MDHTVDDEKEHLAINNSRAQVECCRVVPAAPNQHTEK